MLGWSLINIINVFLSCIIEMIAINGNKQAIVSLTVKNKFNGSVIMLTGININRWFLDEMHIKFILISLWSRLKHQVFFLCQRDCLLSSNQALPTLIAIYSKKHNLLILAYTYVTAVSLFDFVLTASKG